MVAARLAAAAVLLSLGSIKGQETEEICWCSGKCSIFGDPHVRQFDGTELDLHDMEPVDQFASLYRVNNFDIQGLMTRMKDNYYLTEIKVGDVMDVKAAVDCTKRGQEIPFNAIIEGGQQPIESQVASGKIVCEIPKKKWRCDTRPCPFHLDIYLDKNDTFYPNQGIDLDFESSEGFVGSEGACVPESPWRQKNTNWKCRCGQGPTQPPSGLILIPTTAPSMAPTPSPTMSTSGPTPAPTLSPTMSTSGPTPAPTLSPTMSTSGPTPAPTLSPTMSTSGPTPAPTLPPSVAPTQAPTLPPSSEAPTQAPTLPPSSEAPTQAPTLPPSSEAPTQAPTLPPSSEAPTQAPTLPPSSEAPTQAPTLPPSSEAPTQAPTLPPSSEAPTMAPTLPPSSEAPTQAPTMTMPPSTLSPTTSPTPDVTPAPTLPIGGNLTCDVWGDPHVVCFNGDEFSANPQETNNLTTLYTMGEDRFLVVGELNQTLNENNTWVTYVETAYVKFNDQWVARVSSRDCKPLAPVLRSGMLGDSEDNAIRAYQQYSWNRGEEAITLRFTCPGEGLDIFFNKMDLNPDAIAMGALEWEKAQPGYGGNCLKCGYVPFDGEVPRTDSNIEQTMKEGDEAETLRFDSPELDDTDSGIKGSTVTLMAVFIAAAAFF